MFFTEFNEATPFRVHSDDAPTFYIQGNPAQTDAVTRRFEQEAGLAQGFDPLDLSQSPSGSTNKLAQALADQSEQDLLHMITSDPARTPNFILFGNPDYFLSASGSPALCNPAVPSDFRSCFTEEGPKGFAWNHGDFQNDITQTWLGIVGPGVQPLGEFGSVFSDHTDIRPTMLNLLGLTDDYAHDGRVLFEAFTQDAARGSLRAHQDMLSALAAAYKAINAPVGELGLRTLTGISTTATSGNDATYTAQSGQIRAITAQRNQVAGQMIAMLEDAAFNNKPIDEAAAASLIKQAQDLIASVP